MAILRRLHRPLAEPVWEADARYYRGVEASAPTGSLSTGEFADSMVSYSEGLTETFRGRDVSVKSRFLRPRFSVFSTLGSLSTGSATPNPTGAPRGSKAGGDFGDDDEVFSSPPAVPPPTAFGLTMEDRNNGVLNAFFMQPCFSRDFCELECSELLAGAHHPCCSQYLL